MLQHQKIDEKLEEKNILIEFGAKSINTAYSIPESVKKR